MVTFHSFQNANNHHLGGNLGETEYICTEQKPYQGSNGTGTLTKSSSESQVGLPSCTTFFCFWVICLVLQLSRLKRGIARGWREICCDYVTVSWFSMS